VIPLLVAQVEIEQHYVNFRMTEYFQGLGSGTALGNHLKVRLRCQQARQTFSKEGMIVHQ
jgi:hypothetical protein